jgi:hypothetical protein
MDKKTLNFTYRPIDHFKQKISLNKELQDKITMQGDLFLQCFKEKIFKEYEIKNYISFEFIIQSLINLNKNYENFTTIPVIISPDITIYNKIHIALKEPLKFVSKNQSNKFLFDKVCILLGWYNIDNLNNEIIYFL